MIFLLQNFVRNCVKNEFIKFIFDLLFWPVLALISDKDSHRHAITFCLMATLIMHLRVEMQHQK